MSSLDLHQDRVLASLRDGEVKLDLGTAELCCLVGMQQRSQRTAQTSFAEEDTLDIFEEMCAYVDGQSPRRRASTALARLREQRLLARIDGAGLVQTGHFCLTGLGRAIVGFYDQEESLNPETLSLLMETLRAELMALRTEARAAETEEQWRRVTRRIQVTVQDLVSGIERRQRGLDVQQEMVRERIQELLQADWFGAIQGCEELLSTTASTLSELNLVLLRDSGELLDLLDEIARLAVTAEQALTQRAADEAGLQVERVKSWGRERQAAWSDYFQYLQRYLRTVVRLDPERALSHRLRDGLAAWSDSPYYWLGVEPEALVEWKEWKAPVSKPPVERPRQEWSPPVQDSSPSPEFDLQSAVQKALDGGAVNLTEVLLAVLPDVPEPKVYRTIGRVAEILARLTLVQPQTRRPWVELGDFEVEQWKLAGPAR